MRRMRIAGFVLAVFLAFGIGPAWATDPSLTANPASTCNATAGALTCPDIISWDKGNNSTTSTFEYYLIYMVASNQMTGRSNAAWPGAIVACGPASLMGVGSRTLNLVVRTMYRFNFAGTHIPCIYLEQKATGLPLGVSLLEEIDIWVQ